MTVIRACVLTFMSMVIVAGLALADSPSTPAGWSMTGNAPQLYAVAIDASSRHNGAASVSLTSTQASDRQLGSLAQMFSSQNYAGKRLSFSAYVKSADVSGWAGLWLRVDGDSSKLLSFDNMHDRPIRGTTDWKEYTIVLDVPPESRDIALGILLSGQGKVWISGISLKPVSQAQPTTGVSPNPNLPAKPQNLDFSH